MLFLKFYTFWCVGSCRILIFICTFLVTNETDRLSTLVGYFESLLCELPIPTLHIFSYCFLPFSFGIFEVLWIFWIKVLYQIDTNTVYQSVTFIFILSSDFDEKKLYNKRFFLKISHFLWRGLAHIFFRFFIFFIFPAILKDIFNKLSLCCCWNKKIIFTYCTCILCPH